MGKHEPPDPVKPVKDIDKKNGKPRKRAKLELLEHESEIVDLYIQASRRSFMTFIRGLTIDGQFGPTCFDDSMATFQRRCFEDLAPNVEALRSGRMPPTHRRFWIERTKKASKDADLAAIALWLLLFPERPFYIQVGAGDKKQAAIVKSRIEALMHLNPWMNEFVEVVRYQVRSKQLSRSGVPLAALDIEATNISGAHGGTPDLLIINELTHIEKWDFANTLMDNADGVAQGIAIIATNAGHQGTPAMVWRENAITSDAWCVHIWDRPAPWHDQETIKDAEQRLTPSRFKRLWKGIWPSGKGDAIPEESIERMFVLDGPRDPHKQKIYVKGLDLAVTGDHAAYVVLEIDHIDRKIRTARWRHWKPEIYSEQRKRHEIDLVSVYNTIIEWNKIYKGTTYYDPTEAALMVQTLPKNIPMLPVSFGSPTNLTEIANALKTVAEQSVLECYDDDEGNLRRDFGKLEIVDKGNRGLKVEAVSDTTGHADRAVALLIPLPRALEILGMSAILGEDIWLAQAGGEIDLTDEEIEEMPDALRGIYQMDFE